MPAGNLDAPTQPRQAPGVAAPPTAGQPNAPVHPASAILRPSELLDNWAAVSLLTPPDVIAVLLLRKHG